MSERVCAAIVTFNRKELLEVTLRAVLEQTRRSDSILVVNNASTDGTSSMLAAEFPEITVLNLPVNVGGAGGFRAGIEWAFNKGFDWLWVMDDDIRPYPNALEKMLEYKAVSHFINPRRETREGAYPWDYIWDLSVPSPVRYLKEKCFDGDREWVAVNGGHFEGALIHRDVVAKIGLPDERFFVMGDDTIYGFLAHFHTNVIYLREVTARRLIEDNSAPTWRRLYFGFRNRFLIKSYIAAEGLPVVRSIFWLRLLNDVAYWLVQALKGKAGPRAACVGAIWRGVCDGATGRFGVPYWIK